MPLRIKRAIGRVPGGMVIIPLLCGTILNTVAPRAGVTLGSFTGALLTGALPLLAVFYVCMGSTLRLGALPLILRRGGVLLAAKVSLGILTGVVLGHWLGSSPIRAGWCAGFSTLAAVAAINDTNGGLYMALMSQYGHRQDAGAYSVMALESGPFFTMITLGVAGLSTFPWETLVGAILPLAAGIVLGNLDPDLRELLGGAAPALIPFFAFALGATLNLGGLWRAGFLGILLGLAVVLVSGSLLFWADRLTGGTGVAGVAAATTAGNAAAVPALIAAADARYAEAAGPATLLVASSVIVSSILVPPITAWLSRRVNASAVQEPHLAPTTPEST